MTQLDSVPRIDSFRRVRADPPSRWAAVRWAALGFALLTAGPAAAPAQTIEPDSVSGLSRLERYDASNRRDARLSFGSLRPTVVRGPTSALDFHLAVSDQPLPSCLDLRDPWELTQEVAASGRTLVVLRIRQDDQASDSGDWFVTARVFESQIEGFESYPRRAFEIESATELIQDGRIHGRIQTQFKSQVSGPVWFLRLRVDLPLEEVNCDRS